MKPDHENIFRKSLLKQKKRQWLNIKAERETSLTSDYVPGLVVGQRIIMAASGWDLSNVTQSLVVKAKV